MGRLSRKLSLSELDNFALSIYEGVKDYVERSGQDVDVSTQERLLDLRSSNACELWRAINSLERSCGPSKQKQRDFVRLLTWIDSNNFQWEWSDQRSFNEQKEEIRKIGKCADSLVAKITRAKQGYVTQFLDSWSLSGISGVDLGDIVSGRGRNLRGPLAWHRRKEILGKVQFPSDELILLLSSLGKTAMGYVSRESKRPASQLGLSSRKKSKTIFCVIRLHVSIEKILGRAHHKLNSHLSSLALDEEISSSRVEEIVIRARKRGEIEPLNSKKSPRP